MKHQKKINKKFGSENPMWKGDDVGYSSLHEYMRKHLPMPDLCQGCNLKPACDLANKGVYDRGANNWEWLCRGCHMKKDRRMKNLWRGIKDRKRWRPPKIKYGSESPNWKGGFRSIDPVEYGRLWQKHKYWKQKVITLLILHALGFLNNKA